jgi:hypothetical protein
MSHDLEFPLFLEVKKNENFIHYRYSVVLQSTELDSTVRQHKLRQTKTNQVPNKLEVSLCHETHIDLQSTDLQSNARQHPSDVTVTVLAS